MTVLRSESEIASTSPHAGAQLSVSTPAGVETISVPGFFSLSTAARSR
jgi:hypothetical protein